MRVVASWGECPSGDKFTGRVEDQTIRVGHPESAGFWMTLEPTPEELLALLKAHLAKNPPKKVKSTLVTSEAFWRDALGIPAKP